MKVVLIAPIAGNGGIKSWANKLIENFDKPDVDFIRLSGTDRRVSNCNSGPIRAVLNGIRDMLGVCFQLRKVLNANHIDILHETTSGGMGCFRDYLLSKIATYYKTKKILHCHFGSVSLVYNRKNIIGWITRKAFRSYDQIWVLDNCSYTTLSGDSLIKEKVFLTPNSIRVPEIDIISPKQYRNIGFVGNIQESKGVLDLAEAVYSLDNTFLHFIGPTTDSEDISKRIINISKNKFGSMILMHGKLPNEEAIELMNSFDIVSLPTFYQNEAFPISILEAMSRGKLVISTKRAAIPDILTSLDGGPCGILVNEHNPVEIHDAILWCQNNPEDADTLCIKAYKKVYESYREEVVFNLYYRLYKELVN